MPSPASQFRAPLLWLLVPLMAGLVAARLWPVPGCGLAPLLGLAALPAVGAAASALGPGRGSAVAWALCLGVAVSLGGFILLHARFPTAAVDTRPPREVTLTIE